jgi:hypothetical protein
MPNAERVKQGDLRRDTVEGVVVLHHLATELDDEDVVAIGAHVAQRAFEAAMPLLGSIIESRVTSREKLQQQCALRVEAILGFIPTTEFGPSSTASSISTFLRTGRQCMTMPVEFRVLRARSAVIRQCLSGCAAHAPSSGLPNRSSEPHDFT